jgi:ankyrin repeat protein
LAGPFSAQYGWTALIWAARYGYAECVRLLLDAGADKNAKTDVRASRSGPLCFYACLYKGSSLHLIIRAIQSFFMRCIFPSYVFCRYVIREYLLLPRCPHLHFAFQFFALCLRFAQNGKTALDWAKQNGKHDVARMIDFHSL